MNKSIDQIYLTDIYRKLYLTTAEYPFSSSEHGHFSSADHTLGHVRSVSKFKKTEIIPSTFSDHKGMKLEIKTRRKLENSWIHKN